MRNIKSEMLRLYAVADCKARAGRTPAEQVELALAGGATCVQLREKEKSVEEIMKTAEEIKAVCRKYGAPFIINDSPELAKACGADGVHIGKSDGSVQNARKILGDGKIIGVSARTVCDAKKAEADGADYIGTGAVFKTFTKTDAEVISAETVREIAGCVDIPVTAIGGICTENILSLKGSGISGAALAGGIFEKADIKDACLVLKSRADSLKMPIKGAIFDLDGTLLNSMHIWYGIAAKYLESKGISAESDVYARLRAMTVERAAAYLKERYDICDSIEKIMADTKIILRDCYDKSAYPKAGAREFLEKLKENGVKICIATATEREIAKAVLKKHGISDYIERIFTCYEYGGKDKPEIYNAALEYLNIDKKDVWVFEDASHCIKTAKGAGFNVCAVEDEFEEKTDFVREKADIYLRTFERAGKYFD